MKIVLKLTGKLFDVENIEILKVYSKIISRRYELGDRFIIVCGGGAAARQYISVMRALGINEGWSDIIGIEVSRINALLLNALLGDIAYNHVPTNIDEFLIAWSSGKIVTLGGLQPGQSTNAVAMIVAELINADLVINATDVDGVYDKDPKKYSDARLLSTITISDLKAIIKGNTIAGSYELFDQLALTIAERSKIKLYFINAFQSRNIINLLEGSKFIGTEVVYV
ncbi:MAG: UMP kinase [Sulfolobales archaeon]